jgi:hypothetical protein
MRQQETAPVKLSARRWRVACRPALSAATRGLLSLAALVLMLAPTAAQAHARIPAAPVHALAASAVGGVVFVRPSLGTAVRR